MTRLSLTDGKTPATMNVAPATFIGKQEKNRTQRNSELSDSPPTCFIYPAT